MVTAIRYLLRSFGLLDENDQPNETAEYLFGENGKDTFLEDFGSIWLLHYLLVKQMVQPFSIWCSIILEKTSHNFTLSIAFTDKYLIQK